MKTFFKTFVIFILILFSYFGFNALLNRIIFSVIDVPVGNVNVLIAGDSYLEHALNPALMNSAQNISQAGETYVITYWKLKYLLPKVKIDTLILGFSYHNISGFNDLKFTDKRWSSEMFERIYLIQHLDQLENIEVDYPEFYKMYFRKMCLYPHLDHFPFIGNYSNSLQNNISDFDKEIDRHYYFQNRPVGISSVSLMYLDSIIGLCRSNKITPVLVGSPLGPEYLKRIPSETKIRYQSEKLRYVNQQIVVFDFCSQFYDDKSFLNSDHLNERGAARFTREFLNSLHQH